MAKMTLFRDNSLYLVLSETYGNGRSVLEIARRAMAGGVDILQMREKQKSRQDLLALGRSLLDLCREHGAPFIVNDDPRLAQELNASGVHLGQKDLALYPVDEVRRIIGPQKIIGVSTHSREQFRQANSWDIDYIAFGPIFPTMTKNYHIGLDDVKNVLHLTEKPVVFIGGIQMSNIDALLEEGATNVAMIRNIMQADDITDRVQYYKGRLAGKKGGRA